MNTVRSTHHPIVFIALLLAIVALAMPAQAVFAAPEGPERPAAASTPDFTNLEILLQRERLMLQNQQQRIQRADQATEKTQTFIDNQKAAGHKTSSLEATLNNFRQAVEQTQSYNDTAAALLASPAGFDDQGQVIDGQQARQTLREAGQALRLGHLSITQATIELRLAVREYAENLKTV